jgi:RNA polymerase sigma-70 factor (ECF subfamily)
MAQLTSGSTSSSLIRRVRDNDPDAWARLAKLYGPLAFGWCKQAGLQSADIADIVQNVFTSVYKNIGRFRNDSPTDSFRGWLWTITRNEVRMYLRRREDQPNAVGGTDAQHAIQQIPQLFENELLPIELSEQQHVVHRALRLLHDEFEETTWQAFWRTAIEGQPGPQVAEELQISPGAVRQAKYAVLQRLRKFLADD